MNDPLPIVTRDVVDKFHALPASSKSTLAVVEHQTSPLSQNLLPDQPSRDETSHKCGNASSIPYSILPSALTDRSCVDFCSEVPMQGTAPLLMASETLSEFNVEYCLPNCYNLDELKNIYFNCSLSMIDVLEAEFLEVRYIVRFFDFTNFGFINNINYMSGNKL